MPKYTKTINLEIIWRLTGRVSGLQHCLNNAIDFKNWEEVALISEKLKEVEEELKKLGL